MLNIAIVLRYFRLAHVIASSNKLYTSTINNEPSDIHAILHTRPITASHFMDTYKNFSPVAAAVDTEDDST